MGTSFLEVLIKMANEWCAEKDPTHEQQLDQFPGAHLWNRTLLLHRAATSCHHCVFPPQGWNKSRCLDNAGLNSYKENCLPHPLNGPLYSPSHSCFGLHKTRNGCRDFTFSVKIVQKMIAYKGTKLLKIAGIWEIRSSTHLGKDHLLNFLQIKETLSIFLIISFYLISFLKKLIVI